MFAERAVVILEKYKPGLEARPCVGSLGLVTLDSFPKRRGEFIRKASALARIKFSCNRKPQSNSGLVLYPVPDCMKVIVKPPLTGGPLCTGRGPRCFTFNLHKTL